MRNRIVTAHIPDRLARKLDNLAERLDRPRSWVVKEALKGYLALDKERHRQTLASLAEVGVGAMVEHGEVKAWSARLTTLRNSRR
jgi:predicted transcriptional regulator